MCHADVRLLPRAIEVRRRPVVEQVEEVTQREVLFADAAEDERGVVRRQGGVRAEQADVFVLDTPVYQNLFSGILKNTLDHLHADLFRHKSVALICHGRERAASQPCDQLRIVAQSLLATVILTQVVTSDADIGLFQGNYILINSRIEKLLIRMAA